MEKRERLEKTIAAEAADRPPVALWRHFPGDDLRAADLAHATIDFQNTYDWDMVIVHPSSTYAVVDYNLQERWQGSEDGRRTVTRPVIQRSLDWTELRQLDPSRGSLGRQTECLRLICEVLPKVPILIALYSAFDQAEMVAGRDQLLRHLRTQPDRLKSGLNVLTENMLRFLEALRKLPLAGICLICGTAAYSVVSEQEYATFGQPYDRTILASLPPRWWLNMIRLEGDLPMFRPMSELPVQAVQWRTQDTEPDLNLGKSMASGAICGGLSSERDLYYGTPNSVRESARDAIARTNQRRLILSTGSPLMLNTPLSNLRAARKAVENGGL